MVVQTYMVHVHQDNRSLYYHLLYLTWYHIVCFSPRDMSSTEERAFSPFNLDSETGTSTAPSPVINAIASEWVHDIWYNNAKTSLMTVIHSVAYLESFGKLNSCLSTLRKHSQAVDIFLKWDTFPFVCDVCISIQSLHLHVVYHDGLTN